MAKRAEVIGFSKTWPNNNNTDDKMGAEGLYTWASSYFEAAEQLHFAPQSIRPSPFYCGPVMHMVGLATELTLKAILSGGGLNLKEVRAMGHNTYKMYLASRNFFDEQRFMGLHFANTSHLKKPDNYGVAQLSSDTEQDDRYWRVYFNHLRLLDDVYDKPYRTRYITPGDGWFPETEIILIGTKILLNAMSDRLNPQPIP